MNKTSLSKTFYPCFVLCVFFLFSLNPWIDHIILAGYFAYDIQRIAELCTLFVINSYLIFSTTYRYQSVSIYAQLSLLARRCLTGLLCIGILSGFLAPLTHWALLEVALDIQLFYLVIFITVHNVLWKKISDRLLLGTILIGIMIYIITFLIYYFQQHSIHLNSTRSFPNFMNLRFFAQYQIWTLPCITLPIFLAPMRKHKIYASLIYVMTIFWLSLAVINGAKGLWLSLMLSLFFTRAIFKHQMSPWLRVQRNVLVYAALTGSLILGLIIFFHANHVIEKFTPTLTLFLQNHYSWTALMISSASRIKMAKMALQLIIQHPLLGVGPLHFSYYYPNNMAAHPHNSILLIASEWGIPAICLVFILLFNGFSRWIDKQKTIASDLSAQKDETTIAIALTVSLIAGLVYSLMGGVIITPLSQITFCIILGWTLGIYYRTNDKKIIAINKIHRYAFTLTMMISSLLLLSITIVVMQYLPQKEIQWYLKQNAQQPFYPRFWAQGELQ